MASIINRIKSVFSKKSSNTISSPSTTPTKYNLLKVTIFFIGIIIMIGLIFYFNLPKETITVTELPPIKQPPIYLP